MRWNMNMLIEVALIGVSMVMAIRSYSADRKVSLAWLALGLLALVVLVLGLFGFLRL